ncbi:MAG: ABC transporter permease subunit [Clostridia bacterium]|nr:ABC transporter permease subunit [Clostridia bacterium]
MENDVMQQETTDALETSALSGLDEIEKAESVLGVDRSLFEEPKFWSLQKKRFIKYRKVLWFIIPAALFTFIFSYIPMLGVLFAFKDSGHFKLFGRIGLWNVMADGYWTLENFGNIFNDKFFKAVGNTLLINIIKLVICFPLSIFIAVQLSELKSQTMAKVVLIVICIPNFLSWAVVIATWSGLLDGDGGALNNLLVTLKLNEPNHPLMQQQGLYKFFVIFLSAWKGSGWGCIMFYAGIIAIDKSFYESATLEGANRIHKMWYLTIPMIIPTIALMLVLNISGMLATGLEVVLPLFNMLTDIEESQLTLDVYLYDITIMQPDIPMAATLGVFNGLVGLTLMIVGNFITTKTLKRGLW